MCSLVTTDLRFLDHPLQAADTLALADAGGAALERPSVGARVANVVGSPIERLIGMLPARASSVIGAAARKAIEGALKLSLRTLATNDPLAIGAPPPASNLWHKAASAASGAIGGAFGLAALGGGAAGVHHHHDALDRRRGAQPGCRPGRPPSAA